MVLSIGFIVAGASYGPGPVARAFARRIEGRTTNPVLEAQLADLRTRLADLDHLQARLDELESRAEFTGRLLAQRDGSGSQLHGLPGR